MEIPETKLFIPGGFELGTTLSRIGLLRTMREILNYNIQIKI